MSRSILFWFSVLMFVAGGTLLALGLRYSYSLRGDGTKIGEKFHDPEPVQRLVGANEPWLKSYELTERSERKFGTHELEGKIHVVSFFFASCPGSCKTQNHTLAGLEREFGKEGVKFIAITCDPETDTPAKLREYASENYNAPQDSWYFLTGDLLYTRRIAAEVYGVALDRKSHVEKFILVDRAGNIHGKYAWANEKEFQALKREIRELLKEEPKNSPSEPVVDAEQPTASGEAAQKPTPAAAE